MELMELLQLTRRQDRLGQLVTQWCSRSTDPQRAGRCTSRGMSDISAARADCQMPLTIKQSFRRPTVSMRNRVGMVKTTCTAP